MFCQKCGHENAGEARFCANCGDSFTGAAGPTPPRTDFSGFMCPYCHRTATPLVQKKVSTAGWIVLVVLLFLCFPLFWIGLLMKEDYRVCSQCGIKLG